MSYVSRMPPWSHQVAALQRMEGREAYALLMAMRTGKTKTLLDDWGRLEAAGQCDDLLVIAPAGVYHTWSTAAAEHLGDELRARALVYTWASIDSSKSRKAELVEFMLVQNRPRILLVNVEALSSVPRARDLCLTFLSQRSTMLAIDESTIIKNPRTIRTRFIVEKLRPRAKYRRILSGLPTPKSPLDLYSQFEFLDPKILGYKTYAGFFARHAVVQRIVVNGRGVDIPVAYRDVDLLQQKIEPHSSRVLLEDCYDLPPKMYSTREVPLTAEQELHYKEIKDYATTMLEGGEYVTAKQVIDQILRLHQVLCGHVGTEDGHSREIPERRTETLINLLDEHDGKGIIWCSYDADVRKVADAIERTYGPAEHAPGEPYVAVARFWGGNRSTREAEEKRFLNDPRCRYIVATAAAGGRGRTWTVADLVVYYSNTADLEHRSQSEERAQGVDKIKSVAYVDLVAPGTVDEKMLHILRSKITMAAAVTGDTYREWLI
jgi:SNF2 family DNA or RNA helicase